MLYQLDTENAVRDIKTALIAVLTHTPTVNAMCIGLIKLGDGVKNLDGTGGAFQLVVTVGGQTVEPSPQTITFSTAARAAVWTTPFPVPANHEVILKVLSPNAADADVDVTAYLYDMTFALPGAAYDAAGGLPISDAGGLDLDAKLANTNEVTAARMGALTDWIDGGRLDLILDGILADTAVIGALGAGLTAIPWNAAWDSEVQSEVTDALNAYDPPTNAEMEARTLAAAAYFDPAADTVAHVTLVDTTTTNTDLVTAAAVKATIEAAGSHMTLIKTKTDSLTFTVAGYLNSNVYVINGTTLQGDGSLANPWKPL